MWANICSHGRLSRQCVVCELESEVRRLRDFIRASNQSCARCGTDYCLHVRDYNAAIKEVLGE